MVKIGLAVLCMAVLACSDNKKKDKEEGPGFSYQKFSESFKTISPPYQLSDTGLLKNKDTASINYPAFFSFIPDSIKTKLFGKNSSIKYVPLVQMKLANASALYFVKAMSGSKKAVLIYAFEKENLNALFPFLIPDADPTTSQTSSIDKSFVITKNVFKKLPNSIVVEGKDVYEYDATTKQFALILTDPISNQFAEVINPIDTFPRKHKLAGDYGKDKKNFISIRDGRVANQLLVFMHLDKNKSTCTGELKGDILLTSANTAIYRQGGDPCVMTLRFTASSVTVKEDEGCASHRGQDCVFDGTFLRKKETKPKQVIKKTKP